MAKAIKNLLNPTSGQIVYRNRLWADELLANGRKANGEMRNAKTRGRCCLRVAEDLAIKFGVDVPERGTGQPHNNVAKFFGWGSVDPTLNLPNGETSNAATINDDDDYRVEGSRARIDGMPHKNIAECVLNTFVRPSKKKWTFKLANNG